MHRGGELRCLWQRLRQDDAGPCRVNLVIGCVITSRRAGCAVFFFGLSGLVFRLGDAWLPLLILLTAFEARR